MFCVNNLTALISDENIVNLRNIGLKSLVVTSSENKLWILRNGQTSRNKTRQQMQYKICLGLF